MSNILCVGVFKINPSYLVLKTVKMSNCDNDLHKTMNLESYEDDSAIIFFQ